ncbi:nuclease-related domain-containing protein [Streptomyces antimycoticus]|uniref:nuclease-related domain-containing protein n=1 Tax=Streptomyces antimycoticus TaxID=68175 RepID=UPI0036855EEE
MKRRFLALVGMDRAGTRLEAEARSWDAGEEGERRTKALLVPLAREGWEMLHDRRIPGAHSANVDHVVVAPSGRAFLVDSKLWHGRARVRVLGGQLAHGSVGKVKEIDTVLFETRLTERALGTTVTPLIAMHVAPVDGGGFIVRGVPVVPADRLVELLRRNAGRPDPVRARVLAERALRVLPRYVE